MNEPARVALRMRKTSSHVAAVADSHGDWTGLSTRAAIAQFRRLLRERVHGGRNEIDKLDLWDRPHPVIAAPIEELMITPSASGESMTRSLPNFSNSPLVALKAPPILPTSSPIRRHWDRAPSLREGPIDRVNVSHDCH